MGDKSKPPILGIKLRQGRVLAFGKGRKVRPLDFNADGKVVAAAFALKRAHAGVPCSLSRQLTN